MKNPVTLLRGIALAEAISYLLLLGVAMPLKYAWGEPLAVRWLGMAHGVLFVVFCWSLLRAMQAGAWPLGRAALVFVAALLPLVPFWLDGRMRGWAAELDAARTGSS